jgi:hypothetical protein
MMVLLLQVRLGIVINQQVDPEIQVEQAIDQPTHFQISRCMKMYGMVGGQRKKGLTLDPRDLPKPGISTATTQ